MKPMWREVYCRAARLNDGSAEATLLFLESGKKLVNWAELHHKWPPGRVAEARGLLGEVERNYRKISGVTAA